MKINYKTNVADLSPPVAVALTLFFNSKKILIMKKSFFFFLCFVIAMICFTNTNGQITKGNWMVGGSAGFTYANNKTTSTNGASVSNLNLSSSIGYFFFDKFSVGLRPGYVLQNVKFTGNIGGITGTLSKYRFYSIGPYVRYYLLSPELRYNILAETSFQFGNEKQSSTGSSSPEVGSCKFSVAAGPVIYFNSSVGAEFLLNFSRNSANNSSYSSNQFGAGIGLQIHLEKNNP